MRMTRRLTALLLSLLMLLTMLPFSAAEELEQLDDMEEVFSEVFSPDPFIPDIPPVAPTAEPTAEPTAAPTAEPTAAPTAKPTAAPTAKPTEAPVIEKAAFRAGLARISAGTRLYGVSGLWGDYVETVSGGVVYAAEQTADEKAIRIVLFDGASLLEGWVRTDAVRMLTEEQTEAYDREKREENTFRVYSGHELAKIATASTQPTQEPEVVIPDDAFEGLIPLLTPEPGMLTPGAEPTMQPESAPSEKPAATQEPAAVPEEETFVEFIPEVTSAPIEAPVFEEEETAEIGKFVEYRALEAPSGLHATHTRTGKMTLTWNGTSDADAYQVLYKASWQSDYSVLTTTTDASYSTSALDPGTVYYFRVRGVQLASNGSVLNASPHSASYPYIVLGDAKIDDPRGKDTSTIRLTWSAVPGANRYDVMMSIHGKNEWSIVRTDLTGALCDIRDISFDETYDFRVIPKRVLSNGTVITGNSSRVAMVGSPMETPSFQRYDWTSTGLKLTWDAIPGASGYVIYRRAFSETDVTNYKKLVVLDEPVTTYTDTTMVPGEVYYYFVYSFKTCQPEGWRCFSLKGEIGMGVWLPMSESVTALDYNASSVLVSWPAVTGASHYDVYATRNATAMPGAASGSRTQNTMLYHNSAVLGMTYYYFVRPVRIFSNGDVSMGPWSLRTTHVHQDANVTYRALLIGNTYPNETNHLPGCDNDARAMASMLSRMPGTPYKVSVQLNLSDSRMISAISDTFAGADDNDVSLFYFSGHGANSPDTAFHGALVGTLHTYLSVSRLKEALDQVPGKKIVIIDSCHSGAMIGKSAGEAVSSAELSAFNSSVISAFASNPGVVAKAADAVAAEPGEEIFGEEPLLIARGANDLANSGYYVITAAHSSEQSVSMGYDSDKDNKAEKYFGLFTYGLCYGSGWNVATESAISTLHADRDSNGEITLYEAYVYAKAMAQRSNPNQTAQIYPSNNALVIWSK